MDIKLFSFIFGTIVGLISFGLYQKSMSFDGPTKPHPLSWAVWLMTCGIATYGTWVGEGGYGTIYYTMYTVMILITLIRTIKRVGFSNADRVDVYMFLGTLPAIPLVLFVSEAAGVILVTLIDVIGYFFSWRKCYREPWSEPLLSWVLAIPTLILITIAMGHYNFLTVFYSVVTIVACVILITICLYRRPRVDQFGAVEANS